MQLQRIYIETIRLIFFGIRQKSLYMPNVFAVYYKGRPLKETFQNWLLLTPEKLITMKSYRSPLNNSDDIFSVSFPYRFRIVSVSFPYRFRINPVSFPYRSPIILLSSSYCEAENNTEWSGKQYGMERKTNEWGSVEQGWSILPLLEFRI